MENQQNNGALYKWLLGLTASLFVIAGLTGWFRYHLGDKNRENIQAAARADLALIANAQKSFKERFGTYTTDLVSLGIAPKYVYYKIGFVKSMATEASDVPVPGHDPTRMDLDAVKKARPTARIGLSEQTGLDKIDFASLDSFCPDCTATADTFRAMAVANLDEDETLDVWTVDHEGKIDHLSDDLKQQ